jgi:hypothetical protein
MPCDPSCPGWAVFEVEAPSGWGMEPRLEIQRCDTCDRYPDDEGARQSALRYLRDIETVRAKNLWNQWLEDV